MRTALTVRGLEKRYGFAHALKEVDLEVAEGELFGLLGPKGAGKSTLVKIAVTSSGRQTAAPRSQEHVRDRAQHVRTQLAPAL